MCHILADSHSTFLQAVMGTFLLQTGNHLTTLVFDLWHSVPQTKHRMSARWTSSMIIHDIFQTHITSPANFLFILSARSSNCS